MRRRGRKNDMSKPTLQEQMKHVKKFWSQMVPLGTAIQQEDLTEADFGSEDLDGCNEILLSPVPMLSPKYMKLISAAGAGC